MTRRTKAGVVVALTLCLAGPVGRDTLRGQDRASTGDTRTIHHVLNRMAFGARPGEVERVRAAGLSAHIDRQLNPSRIDDAALDARLATLTTLSLSSAALAEKFFLPAREAQRQRKQQQTSATAGERPGAMAGSPKPQLVLNELTQARLLRAVGSERQLQEVLVDFWFNHFNVFSGKGQVRGYLTEYERDVIRPHVLGRFRDLLGAVAHSPAMLFYLDNWQSASPNARAVVSPPLVRRLNDPRTTPARRGQLQQRLQQAQSRRPARGLNENYGRELLELHTLGVDGGYTQQDVIDAARILTGWTIDRPQQGGGFVFRTAMHDTGEKVVLGRRFPAGHGEDEGEALLDLLASHPSTAHHIAFKLAQRFVSDDPPAALVDRAAAVFRRTDGDLREVVRAIVTSPEFFAPAAYRAKVKTPLEFVVSAVRETGAIVNSAQPLAAALRADLGMPLFGCQPPTGYSNTADAWVNTGALLARMNFALRMAEGIRGIRVEQAVAGMESGALTDALLAGDVSSATSTAVANALTPQQRLALTLGSPEFQRR